MRTEFKFLSSTQTFIAWPLLSATLLRIVSLVAQILLLLTFLFPAHAMVPPYDRVC